jgi:hypothetical protein
MYNERGIELGAAYVTERIIPGATYMDHGSRPDFITDKINRVVLEIRLVQGWDFQRIAGVWQ